MWVRLHLHRHPPASEQPGAADCADEHVLAISPQHASSRNKIELHVRVRFRILNTTCCVGLFQNNNRWYIKPASINPSIVLSFLQHVAGGGGRLRVFNVFKASQRSDGAKRNASFLEPTWRIQWWLRDPGAEATEVGCRGGGGGVRGRGGYKIPHAVVAPPPSPPRTYDQAAPSPLGDRPLRLLKQRVRQQRQHWSCNINNGVSAGEWDTEWDVLLVSRKI